MPKTDLCAATKALADRKLRVFPLTPNSKLPAIRSWPTAASDVADTIDSIFQNHPQANIGVATGHGLMVLDFDTKNGQQGLQFRFVLEAMGLPDTLEAATPSGGAHLYFNVPETVIISNSVGRLSPGVDVRGHHGYVVAPPSCIDGRNYQWVDHKQKIADAPDWLIEMCQQTQRERHIDAEEPLGPIDTPEALARGAEWLRESAPTAVEGDHGDVTTFKVAATLKDFGIGIERAFDLMLEHWNDCKAAPPWDPDELMAKVESAFHSGRNRPGSADAAAQFGAVDILVIAKNDSVPATKRRMYRLGFDEAASLALTIASDPLIEGVLEKREVSVLYGQWGQGKSFVALDMAYCVATGRPWNGHNAERGLVVYLAAEGGKGMLKRLAALRQEFGGGATIDVIPCSANLYNSQKDMAELMECIAESEAAHGMKVAMVVVDTLHKVFVGGDENSSSDFGAMLHKMAGLVERTRAHVMLVHHAGKDLSKGTRGSSSLPADIETVLVVNKNTLEMTKQKDEEKIRPLGFSLDKVQLGLDGQGRPITSCVVRWGAAEEFAPQMPMEPGSEAEVYWKAFKDACVKKAPDPAEWGDVSITTTEWKDAYILRLKAEKRHSDARLDRTTLYRLRCDVVERGWIRQSERNQWVAVNPCDGW